jgi:hypothetical protein
MPRSEYDLLLDELAAAQRRRDSDLMQKAVRAEQDRRLERQRASLLRSVQDLERTAEAQRAVVQKAEQKVAQDRRRHYAETFAKAYAALGEEVRAGRMNAHQAAAEEARLHRLAPCVRIGR